MTDCLRNSTTEYVIPDPWECIKCGMCCMRYEPSTDSIVRCQYLQIEDNLCSIYEDRPIACKLGHMSDSLKTTHCNISIMSIQNKMTQESIINTIRDNAEELLTDNNNNEEPIN